MKRTELKIFLFVLALLFYFYPFTVKADYNDGYASDYDYADENVQPRSDVYYSNDHSAEYTENVDRGPRVVEENPDANDSADDSTVRHGKYDSRFPPTVKGFHEKMIVVNPRVHTWGAYDSNGNLLRTGLASAGARWCPDIKRSCRTKVGTFRIYSLGDERCYSRRYPVGRGGAPMPYCMYFNNNQGIHGSHELAEANISHGCVRISVSDAQWIRYHFATIGTKVLILSY
jgi:lipoprotein-anchoring transpeptidase ErfK/SrfK